jgi:hypothetical protein
LIRDAEGVPQYFVGEVLDITKRKQAEAALSDMARKLVEAQELERARIARELHVKCCYRPDCVLGSFVLRDVYIDANHP